MSKVKIAVVGPSSSFKHDVKTKLIATKAIPKILFFIKFNLKFYDKYIIDNILKMLAS